MTSYAYQAILEASGRANWQVEDLLGPGGELDFDRPFLPEGLAPAGTLDFLTPREQRRLNQLRGVAYTSIFGRLEAFLVPFILDQVDPELDLRDVATRARLGTVGEETKHILLFREMHETARRGLGLPEDGEPEPFHPAGSSSDPLAAALLALHLDWITQQHFSASVMEDGALDPSFAGLFRLHWTEETQHAALDADLVMRLALGRSPKAIAGAVDTYLEMLADLDRMLVEETAATMEVFSGVTGRILDRTEYRAVEATVIEGLRWTFLGSGMTHPRFLRTVESISREDRLRIEGAGRGYRR